MPIEPCVLRLTELRTGRAVTLGTVPGLVAQAAFDPSGRYVAVTLDDQSLGAPPRPGDAAAVVYDTVTRRAAPLRGLTFPPFADSVAWSADGWLLLTHERRTESGAPGAHALALWRPGMAGPVAAGEYPGTGLGRFVLRSE